MLQLHHLYLIILITLCCQCTNSGQDLEIPQDPYITYFQNIYKKHKVDTLIAHSFYKGHELEKAIYSFDKDGRVTTFNPNFSIYYYHYNIEGQDSAVRFINCFHKEVLYQKDSLQTCHNLFYRFYEMEFDEKASTKICSYYTDSSYIFESDRYFREVITDAAKQPIKMIERKAADLEFELYRPYYRSKDNFFKKDERNIQHYKELITHFYYQNEQLYKSEEFYKGVKVNSAFFIDGLVDSMIHYRHLYIPLGKIVIFKTSENLD